MAYVTWVLRHCNHNGFPVVRGAPGDSDADNSEHLSLDEKEGQSSREGPLEGVILRSQLMVLLINKVALQLPNWGCYSHPNQGIVPLPIAAVSYHLTGVTRRLMSGSL